MDWEGWIGMEWDGRLDWDGNGNGWTGIDRWIGMVGLDWIGIEHKIILTSNRYMIKHNIEQ